MNSKRWKNLLPVAVLILGAAAFGHAAQAQQPAAPAAPTPSVIPPLRVIGEPPAAAPKKKHRRHHHCKPGGKTACHAH